MGGQAGRRRHSSKLPMRSVGFARGHRKKTSHWAAGRKRQPEGHQFAMGPGKAALVFAVLSCPAAPTGEVAAPLPKSVAFGGVRVVVGGNGPVEAQDSEQALQPVTVCCRFHRRSRLTRALAPAAQGQGDDKTPLVLGLPSGVLAR